MTTGTPTSGVTMPGGSVRPSQPDLALTGVLRQQALPLGLRLLDHIIITDGECYSILQDRIFRSDPGPKP